MSSSYSTVPPPVFTIHPHGMLPGTSKGRNEIDLTDVTRKSVNVWWDLSKGLTALKAFSLSTEDSGALIRLDLSQQWAEQLFTMADSTTVKLQIELPMVTDMQALKYDFDFTMQKPLDTNRIKSNLIIEIIPYSSDAYTAARMVGGVFVVTADAAETGVGATSLKVVSPQTSSLTGLASFNKQKLVIRGVSASKPVHAIHMSASQVSFETCGVRDHTKYSTGTEIPKGDVVYWRASGMFFGEGFDVDFKEFSA